MNLSNLMRQIMRDGFGQTPFPMMGHDIEKSWFFAPKSQVKRGNVSSVCNGEHVTVHFDLSLRATFMDVLTGARTGKHYRMVIRRQPMVLGSNGIDRLRTQNDNSFFFTDRSVREVTVLEGFTKESISQFESQIDGKTNLLQWIHNAREQAGIADQFATEINDLRDNKADVTRFIMGKEQGFRQGMRRPIYHPSNI